MKGIFDIKLFKLKPLYWTPLFSDVTTEVKKYKNCKCLMKY